MTSASALLVRVEIVASRVRAIGIIIPAVAVLDIHIDRKAQASMKPSNNRRGAVPTTSSTRNAIRVCRFCSSMATAII